jgi:hypothetical protein
MAIEQTLVPSYVNILYDGTELIIVDVNVSVFLSNGSIFEEIMTGDGSKGYMLRKGISVEQRGKISIKIIKAGDKGADKSITTLEEIAKAICKSEDPKDYAKSIVISFSDSGEVKFLTISFSGFLESFDVAPPGNNDFTHYIAVFVIYDPLSLDIS